jgi:hypothetical protein
MEHEKLKKTKPFAFLREGYLRHPLQANIGNAFSALPSIKGDERLRKRGKRDKPLLQCLLIEGRGRKDMELILTKPKVWTNYCSMALYF